MYTRIYTDQEKWSVNHITYIVVYTLIGYSFVTYCDVRLHIICITDCYNSNIMLHLYDYGLTWGTECVKLYMKKLR